MRRGDYSFPVAFDIDGAVGRDYGVKTIGGRVLYLIDRSGRLRMRQVRAWSDAELQPQNRKAVGVVTRLLAESTAEFPSRGATMHDAAWAEATEETGRTDRIIR